MNCIVFKYTGATHVFFVDFSFPTKQLGDRKIKLGRLVHGADIRMFGMTKEVTRHLQIFPRDFASAMTDRKSVV